MKGKSDRKAVFNVVDKLRRLGPELTPPHVKLLKGEADLYELRPQQGRSAVRPLYQRFGNQFVILAVAKKNDFDRKIGLAKERASRYRGASTDNTAIIAGMAAKKTLKLKTHGELVAEEMNDDSDFRAEWQRLALAREIAAELVRFRSQNDLSQRALAERIGVSQPRVAKLESGEHNPDVDTLVSISRATGLEFVIDIAPSDRRPTMVNKKLRDREPTYVEDDVSVIAAVS